MTTKAAQNMPNDRNTRIAQALEPKPPPPSGELSFNSELSPLRMWKRYSFSNTWLPLKFDTDENAWKLAWARLTEEQQDAVIQIAAKERHYGALPLVWYSPQVLTFAKYVMCSTLAERCDWMLAVLEGKP